MKDKKQKTNLIKNFWEGIKHITKYDKSYVFLKIINLIIVPFYTYAFSFILLKAMRVLESDNPDFSVLLSQLIPIIVVCLICSIITMIIYEVIYYKDEIIDNLLARELSLKTLEMDYEKLEQKQAQDELDKARRALNTNNGFMGIVTKGFRFLENLFHFIIGSGIILTVNIYLVLIIVLLSIFKLLLNTKQSKDDKEIRDQYTTLWRKNTYTNSISQNLGLGKDLRVYEMNKFINEERDTVNETLLGSIRKQRKRNLFYEFFIKVLEIIDLGCLYGFLIYEVLYNGMQISTFSFMISSVSIVIWSLSSLTKNFGSIYSSSLGVDDYNLFTSGKYDYICKNIDLSGLLFSIEFKNVYYRYYEQEDYALEDVSFKIEKGEKIAIVGYNGAGKTTIVKLICGLYHPVKGNIYINGVDINDVSRKSLQETLAPVFQDNNIFTFSIATNISMKYKNYDKDKIQKLLKILDLDEKINGLKDKEESILTREFDEDGIELSGGEKQKLLIARSCYKDCDMYILDEPTSAMDAISEANLYENFKNLFKDKGVIFISHRLSSTKICDRIIVLDNGKIIETGTHNELMKNDSLYKELFSMQAEYYKEEN